MPQNIVDNVNHKVYFAIGSLHDQGGISPTNLKTAERFERGSTNMAISELSRSLALLAWHFGPKGLNGECCGDLSMPEFIALDKVSSSRNCSVQEVGSWINFTKSGATKVVNRLEKKGCIQKLKSNEDGRVCCLVITEKGEDILREVDRQYAQQFEALKAKIPGMSVQEIEKVIDALGRGVKG